MRISVINLCMKQAAYFAGRWDGRRNFEWKMSLAMWAVLAATIKFLPEIKNFKCWMPIVPVILHSMWLYGVWKANQFDKVHGRYFRDHAEKLMRHPEVPIKWGEIPEPLPATRIKRIWEFVNDWSMRFQLLTTIVLAAALYWFSRPELAHLPVQ